jgi:hypothetical protein
MKRVVPTMRKVGDAGEKDMATARTKSATRKKTVARKDGCSAKACRTEEDRGDESIGSMKTAARKKTAGKKATTRKKTAVGEDYAPGEAGGQKARPGKTAARRKPAAKKATTGDGAEEAAASAMTRKKTAARRSQRPRRPRPGRDAARRKPGGQGRAHDPEEDGGQEEPAAKTSEQLGAPLPPPEPVGPIMPVGEPSLIREVPRSAASPCRRWTRLRSGDSPRTSPSARRNREGLVVGARVASIRPYHRDEDQYWPVQRAANHRPLSPRFRRIPQVHASALQRRIKRRAERRIQMTLR